MCTKHTYICHLSMQTDQQIPIFNFFFYFKLCGQHDFGNDKDLKSEKGLEK